MAVMRLQIKDQTLDEGTAIAVPRVGDDIRHEGEVVRIEAVIWEFGAADGTVVVTLLVGGQPYTF